MAVEISESSWKAFIKKQKLAVELDDKELLKALVRFDKTDERKPEPRLEALKDLAKEIPKQVTALVKLKKKLGDKPFGLIKDELYGILEEAEALQKKTQAAVDAEDGEDEDSVPSALVNPKLLFKQLSMCRKDPERTMKFAFVDAKGKEQLAMLAMHPRMGARALFAKLQAAAGVKTGAYGSAWIDGMSLMLQLDKPLSGLVKKVRAPVKASGFRITKAVLWNADGTVFEQDDELSEGVEADEPGDADEPVEAGEAVDPKQTEFDRRMAALTPRVLTALREPGPDAGRLRAVAEFARGKGDSGNYPAALQALLALEKMLPSTTTSTGSGGAFVRLQTARLDWEKTRHQVKSELDALAKAIRTAVTSHNADDAADTEYEIGDMEDGVQQLYAILVALDTRLLDALDAALKVEGESRTRAQASARKIVDEYRGFVQSSALMSRIDGNPFQRCTVRSSVDSALSSIGAAL